MGNSCIHGGIYSVNPNLVKLDFSSSVNPLGISKVVLKSIHKNIDSLSSVYPDPDCRELKIGILEYLRKDLNSEWINVGNGAIEIIHNFARAFVRNKVVIPAPTFCEYELASKLMNAQITFVPLQNLNIEADSIIEKAKDSDAIYLCNPNNPTGLLSSNSIKKILEYVKYPTVILLDESFIELVSNGGKCDSLVEKIEEFDNLVIIRSLTKSFGLAGLRVGYSICNPKLGKKLSSYQIPWHVNGIAQNAAICALKDPSHLTKARTLIERERKFMQTHIKRNTKSFVPIISNVNYFLLRLKNIKSTRLRNTLLIRNGILVRDCITFNGLESGEYIRVSVKTHKDNAFLLQALESIDV
jgi:threonine-phosphate decarboxylase